MCSPCRNWHHNLPVSWGFTKMYSDIHTNKLQVLSFFGHLQMYINMIYIYIYVYIYVRTYHPVTSKFTGHPFLDAVELIWASTHQHPKLEVTIGKNPRVGCLSKTCLSVHVGTGHKLQPS